IKDADMWSSGLTLDRSQLSRRTFLGGATGAVGAGALLSARASHGAPAPPQVPGARWLVPEDPAFAVGASVGDLTFVAPDAAGPGELPSGAGSRRAWGASIRRGAASRAHAGEHPPCAYRGRPERGRPRFSSGYAHGL